MKLIICGLIVACIHGCFNVEFCIFDIPNYFKLRADAKKICKDEHSKLEKINIQRLHIPRRFVGYVGWGHLTARFVCENDSYYNKRWVRSGEDRLAGWKKCFDLFDERCDREGVRWIDEDMYRD